MQEFIINYVKENAVDIIGIIVLLVGVIIPG